MIGVETKLVDNTPKVLKEVDRANYKNFSHAAASLRKAMIESIKIDKTTIGWITTKRLSKRGKRIRARIYKPAPVGSPVVSHKNKGFVSRGIRFDATKTDAVVGFAQSVYGDVMGAHEFGGERFGQKFQPRPTVYPTLENNLDRFSGEWAGSIG